MILVRKEIVKITFSCLACNVNGSIKPTVLLQRRNLELTLIRNNRILLPEKGQFVSFITSWMDFSVVMSLSFTKSAY